MRKFQSLAIDPKHQQSLAHLSNYSDSEKKALLRLLIENRVGLRDVKMFSHAFKLVPLEAITMYVNTRMTGVRMIVSEGLVKTEGLPDNSFWGDVHLTMECTTQAFLQILADAFELISPYNYEVLDIILR